MFTFEYKYSDYKQLFDALANRMNTVVKEGWIFFPPDIGEGYMRYLQLPNKLFINIIKGKNNREWFFYRKKDVAVVGGGDTACEDALYLSAICNNVYLIVRRNVLRASQIMQKRIAETPNIQVLFEHETKSLFGEKVVEGAILTKKKGSFGIKK